MSDTLDINVDPESYGALIFIEYADVSASQAEIDTDATYPGDFGEGLVAEFEADFTSTIEQNIGFQDKEVFLTYYADIKQFLVASEVQKEELISSSVGLEVSSEDSAGIIDTETYGTGTGEGTTPGKRRQTVGQLY